jgi:hypothetical protein
LPQNEDWLSAIIRLSNITRELLPLTLIRFDSSNLTPSIHDIDRYVPEQGSYHSKSFLTPRPQYRFDETASKKSEVLPVPKLYHKHRILKKATLSNVIQMQEHSYQLGYYA